MTLYEQHGQEGMDVGFQKGVVREKQEILIKLISKKIRPDRRGKNRD